MMRERSKIMRIILIKNYSGEEWGKDEDLNYKKIKRSEEKITSKE